MPRPILYVPPGGGLFLLTTRTLQGRFLLRPSPRLNDLAIGVVGRAQRLYGVDIHAGVILSNHHHWLVSVRDALQLASFMNYVNGNVAREAGRLHRWSERFWGRRYRPTLVSQEPEAQIERMRYVLAQGCKEGLVASPRDWPGVTCVHALLSGEPLRGIWVNRTKYFYAQRGKKRAKTSEFSEAEQITLTPIPCWGHLGVEAYRRRIRDLVEEIETETADHHKANRSKPVGAGRVRKQVPNQRAASFKRSPAPRFHCASKEARQQLREAFTIFYDAYRQAASRLRDGDRRVEFPDGCFPPRLPFVHHQLAPD